MSRKKRSIEQLRRVSEHLHYEVGMLLAVAHGLESGVLCESPGHNALVESFAIHLRNLVEFLWSDKPKNDQVIAEDYFALPDDWRSVRGAIPEALRAARIRAAKEVTHLTYARLLVTEARKGWSFVALSREIMKTFRLYLRNVPTETLGESWKKP